MSLKDDLIKLGERQPDLQENIQSVLDHFDHSSRSSSSDFQIGVQVRRKHEAKPFGEVVDIDRSKDKSVQVMVHKGRGKRKWFRPDQIEAVR